MTSAEVRRHSALDHRRLAGIRYWPLEPLGIGHGQPKVRRPPPIRGLDTTAAHAPLPSEKPSLLEGTTLRPGHLLLACLRLGCRRLGRLASLQHLEATRVRVGMRVMGLGRSLRVRVRVMVMVQGEG